MGVIVFYFICGFRIVRPTERGVIETLGRYSRFVNPGFVVTFFGFQRLIKVDITESMSEMESQEIITEDNLNADVDLVVYYRIRFDEESIKRALYNVNDVIGQLIILARTTARNVIGTMRFADVNSKRKELNSSLAEILKVETDKWGVYIVRVEMKEIVPPKDVQETMNQVIKAENAKRSAIDFATAVETEADGKKRATIKEAEAQKQSEILKAEGQAQAFELINKSFTGNAQLLRQYEVLENSLENNAKIILTKDGITPQLILGELPIHTIKHE